MAVIGESMVRMGSMKHKGVLVQSRIPEEDGWERIEVLDTATGQRVCSTLRKELGVDRRKAKRAQTGV